MASLHAIRSWNGTNWVYYLIAFKDLGVWKIIPIKYSSNGSTWT